MEGEQLPVVVALTSGKKQGSLLSSEVGRIGVEQAPGKIRVPIVIGQGRDTTHG
jgi:hypothetical protein